MGTHSQMKVETSIKECSPLLGECTR